MTGYDLAITHVLESIDKLQEWTHTKTERLVYVDIGDGSVGQQGMIQFLVNKHLLIQSVKTLGEQYMVSSSSKSLSNPREPEPTPVPVVEVPTEAAKEVVRNPIDLIADAAVMEGMELKYIHGAWRIIEGTKASVTLQQVLEYMFIHNCDRLTAIRAFIS